MITRYTTPEMSKVFSRENRYQLMQDVTIAACEGMADVGRIPKNVYKEIADLAQVNVDRIAEVERETRHDTVAFLYCLAESVGTERARYIHLGTSSSDISDTATALQAQQASDLLLSRLTRLREILCDLALKHKYTLMMGRTHATHAEPITFGLKMAVWVKDVDRCISRLKVAKYGMGAAKLNGAVGSFASIDPRIEMYVCRKLGLHAADVTTQIIQRDVISQYVSTLALIGSIIEKFCTEIRNLQRTEIREVEEHTPEGQLGYNALPHRLRPYNCELISGMARVLRGYSLSVMEGIAVWHEQDSSHTGAERIVFPDSCQLLDYMLAQFITLMEMLEIYPDNMRKNLEKSLGIVFSQRVLLALVEKGMGRDEAYDLVSRISLESWEEQMDFQYLLIQDEEVSRYLTRIEVMELFDYGHFTQHIDYIFERTGISESEKEDTI